MKRLLTPILATAALVGLAACDAQPAGPASPAASAPPANVQQGVGTSQEDRYVTQRGGSSNATRAGRITSVQQEGGGNVTVNRAPSSGTAGTRAQITGQRTDGTVDRGANVGAPNTQGPVVSNPPRQ